MKYITTTVRSDDRVWAYSARWNELVNVVISVNINGCDIWSDSEFNGRWACKCLHLVAVLIDSGLFGATAATLPNRAHTVIPPPTQKHFLGIVTNKNIFVRLGPRASPNPNRRFCHFHFVAGTRLWSAPEKQERPSPAWPKKKTTLPSPSRNEQLTRHKSCLITASYAGCRYGRSD